MESDEADDGEDATTKKAGQCQDQTPQRQSDSSAANAQTGDDFLVVLSVVEKVIFCHDSSVARRIEVAKAWS